MVDARHHLWDFGRNYYPWLVDKKKNDFFLGNYSALKNNYFPRDYRTDAKNFNVIATVHIEAGCDLSNRVGETTCLTKMNALFDMPNAIAGHVWLAEKNCEEALIKYN